ncbi:hypothetical protein RCG19_11985 [Neobacillus sp. OS1-2]|uniref:hypothetical protein n=1 Tax=Neobacillus sp. OS1-2 TaxID=3070680 RepID=UPI0027E0892A|nr:hypothetical protein [Neobacillus sp. OS1-2]WML37968.1 hypothetical protein RCG19_11985 [Neobacillus sp. OS1-2]
MKKKEPFDLKQRQIQKIYKENLKDKKSDNSFFLILIGCFIFLVLLLALLHFVFGIVQYF